MPGSLAGEARSNWQFSSSWFHLGDEWTWTDGHEWQACCPQHDGLSSRPTHSLSWRGRTGFTCFFVSSGCQLVKISFYKRIKRIITCHVMVVRRVGLKTQKKFFWEISNLFRSKLKRLKFIRSSIKHSSFTFSHVTWGDIYSFGSHFIYAISIFNTSGVFQGCPGVFTMVKLL